ncbi:MAG: hypothetical protein QMC96_13235, partial [Methanomicrobiales archaeon]|nr:hypothetical protein [Methanomicrobiales archaeon]
GTSAPSCSRDTGRRTGRRLALRTERIHFRFFRGFYGLPSSALEGILEKKERDAAPILFLLLSQSV